MYVRLPNGKKYPAISLGGSEISDAGMLKITKKKSGISFQLLKKSHSTWRLVLCDWPSWWI